MAQLSEQTKKKRQKVRGEMLKTGGLMAAGIVGGVVLPGKVAGPVGLVLSGLAFAGKPKPWLLALGLPMLGGMTSDLALTGGANWRQPEGGKFSIQDEIQKSGLRGKAYLSALGQSLWLDKIFKKKPVVAETNLLPEGDSGDHLNGYDALAELDRIDARSISERTMEFRGGVNDF